MQHIYSTKKVFAYWTIAIICCLVIGSFAANSVAKESSGYVASTSFFIYLFIFGTPIYLLLLGCGIAYWFVESKKWLGLIFMASSFILPLCFILSLKIMEFIGYANYVNEVMIPIP